jgi:hypothetical protein
MYLDALLQFDPAATAVTVTAASTNSIDLGAARDMGIGRVQGKVLVLIGTAFASATPAATMNVQLQGAPNNAGVAGTFTTIVESGTIPLGQLQAGFKVAQFDVATVSDAISTTATQATTAVVSASTSVPIVSATGLLAGMFVTSNASGVTPGTTISSISGNTLTLSSAATLTSGQTLTFIGSVPVPRFLRLNYVCSNTMTAGTVQAYISLDPDEMIYYPSGFSVPN